MSNNKKSNRLIIIFSVIFYLVMGALMIYGTNSDLQLDKILFNPENMLVKLAESFSQFVYWGIWGIAGTFLFLERRDLNGCLDVIGRIFPFIKGFKNTDSVIYKILNFVLKFLTLAGFFAVCVIGWKKLIENVVKNLLEMSGKADLSQAFYFIFCAVFSVLVIFLCSKIDKKTRAKLEALALAGVLLGICYKIVEECKQITGRVRFREMVAYSNGFFNEKGVTDGDDAPLTREMINNTDFSHFTKWFEKGDNMDGIYAHSNSFPSGHTTYCCSMLLTYPLCLAFKKLNRLAPFAYIFSALYIIAVGFTRMVAGAHYLTDVAGAAIIGYTLFLIVLAVYNKFTEKGIIG